MKNRFLFYWLPLIIWISGIFYVSSLSHFPCKFSPFWSKVFGEYPLHLIAFFVLFLLFYRLLRFNNKTDTIFLYSFAFTMTISLSKECWQILIPTRSFSLKDLMVDGIAALLALVIIKVMRIIKWRIENWEGGSSGA